jgi:D-glycero-alpha-D-manno-heptose-7-phosphate kinase
MLPAKGITAPITANIEDAFQCLNTSQMGIVLVVDSEERVIGCVTDGDIRRRLLQNNDLKSPVRDFLNRDFVWARAGTSREQILKLLDHRVRVVPLLDADNRFVGVCTREEFHPDAETVVFSRARSPARISFNGGGTDTTHHFIDQGGTVINATINRYAHAVMRRREDTKIRIYSHDLHASLEVPDLASLQIDGNCRLLAGVIRLIRPDFGFELEVSADFPIGSGLGGSAAVASAVIGCFNEFRSDPWDRHQIAEMAFQAERLMLDIPGGWQDQYATVFGGFNFMEFSADQNTIMPMRLEQRTLLEIEESVVLCYTGKKHDSGAIHRDQKMRMDNSDEIKRITDRQKQLTREMRHRLLRGDIGGYGRLLHEGWLAKRALSPLISDSEIDRTYDFAIANGALGGKILGAGGGGYFLFFVPAFRRYGFSDAMATRGYQCERLQFEEGGLCSWKTRHDAGDEPAISSLPIG